MDTFQILPLWCWKRFKTNATSCLTNTSRLFWGTFLIQRFPVSPQRTKRKVNSCSDLRRISFTETHGTSVSHLSCVVVTVHRLTSDVFLAALLFMSEFRLERSNVSSLLRGRWFYSAAPCLRLSLLSWVTNIWGDSGIKALIGEINSLTFWEIYLQSGHSYMRTLMPLITLCCC